MLFTLGIDSQFGTLEGVITSLVDMKLFPSLPKEKITLVSQVLLPVECKRLILSPFQLLCASCGVLSLIFANGAGSYIFQLMDSFAGNYTLLIIAFCEVMRRFEGDFKQL
jgi:solute carrier family 6 (neurotransmitter transporter, amino acid/orphan) member 15/16/17/18/20